MRNFRIKLGWLLLIVIASLVAIAGYIQYTLTAEALQEHFTDSVRTTRENRSAALVGIFREWEQKLFDVGGIVAALRDVRDAATRSDAELASRALAENFPTLSLASGAETVTMVDRTGQLLATWGFTATPTFSWRMAQDAIREGRPKTQIKCTQAHCSHVSAIPIFDANGTVGALMLTANVQEFAVMFSAITGYHLEISPARGTSAISAALPLAGDQPARVQLQVPNSSWPSTHGFYTAIDFSTDVAAFVQLRTRMALTDGLLFGLLASLLLLVIWFSLRRVNLITRSMRNVGHGHYNNLSAQLSELHTQLKAARASWWHDDVDDLATGLVAMTEGIKSLDLDRAKNHELLREQLAYNEDLMESVTTPILFADVEGHVLDFNPAFASFFGATRVELLGRSLDAIATDRTSFAALLRATGWIAGNASRDLKEVRFRPAAGQFCHCLVASGPHTRIDGSIVGHIFTFVDMTPLRRIEEKFHVAETAVAAKDNYIGMISHEMRNALQAVLGYASVLQRSAMGKIKSTSDDLAAMKYAAGDLFNIVNDLLDSQRFNAGLKPNVGVVDLRQFLAELQQVVWHWVNHQGNTLVTHIDDSLTAFKSDSHLLHRVLTNVVSNSCKYTDRGLIKITVRATTEQRIIFAIEDSGVGMSEDELTRLFNPLQKAAAIKDRRGRGSGLGLVIARQFVELLGGTLHIDSRLGRGTTVTISLPLTRAEIVPAVAPQILAPRLHALRVLVVDDEAIIRDIVRRILLPNFARVDVADDAISGLRHMGTMSYDLVIADLNMPGLNGLEMMLQHRVETSVETPFILLTGDAEFCNNADNMPPKSACILKPVDESTLLAVSAKLFTIETERTESLHTVIEKEDGNLKCLSK